MIHNLPDKAIAKAKELIKFSNFPSLGIVMHGLTSAELPFYVLNEINGLMSRKFDYEIVIFSLNKELPMLPCLTAVYSSMDLNTYHGTILATDIPGWQATLCSPSTKKFLYIYDVRRVDQASPDLIKKINESGYKIFTRTKKHAEYLKEKGFSSILDETVKFFELEKILEIVK